MRSVLAREFDELVQIGYDMPLEDLSSLGVLQTEPERSKTADLFTVFFYGRSIFCCKTAQFHEMQRKSDSLGSPMKNALCNAVKTCATR